MKMLISRFLPIGLLALFAVGCASTQSEPAAEPEAESSATEVMPAEEPATETAEMSSDAKSYSVVRGDHLWGISSKSTIYGNPYSWPLIFKANRDKIQDADLIEPGWVLSIDENPSSAEVDAAVRHAKSRGEWSLGSTEQSDLDYLAAN